MKLWERLDEEDELEGGDNRIEYVFTRGHANCHGQLPCTALKQIHESQ
jgi:hypothetical protein